jgi:hypothetical protein
MNGHLSGLARLSFQVKWFSLKDLHLQVLGSEIAQCQHEVRVSL